MKLDIIITGKEYPGNRRYGNSNKVYFTLNGDELFLDIIYIENLRTNAFIDCPSLTNVQKYCERNNIDFELFKSVFLYMLYKYSRGIGLEIIQNPLEE